MFKLSEADHAIQQIDECGAMIGISRQWYEEAKSKLAAYEDAEEQGRLAVRESCLYVKETGESNNIQMTPCMIAILGKNQGDHTMRFENDAYLRRLMIVDHIRELHHMYDRFKAEKIPWYRMHQELMDLKILLDADLKGYDNLLQERLNEFWADERQESNG